MKLQEKKYEQYALYAFEENIFHVLEKVVRKEYKIETEFVSCTPHYIAKISIDDNVYILKQYLCGVRIKRKLRMLLTFFRKGNAFKAFFNVSKMRGKGLDELAEICGAGVYKKGIIQDQFILMPYTYGRFLEKSDSQMIEVFLKKLHCAGYYHGDPHEENFILSNENKLISFDTIIYKQRFGNFRAHSDMHIFRGTFFVNTEYPYKKNIFYYLHKGYRLWWRPWF